MCLIFLILNIYAVSTYAQESNHCTSAQPNIIFDPQPIFDESEDGIYAFHHWANWLHITTKEVTLKNEAAFFLSFCHKTPEDLAELERHLRSKKFIRDARVTEDIENQTIKVTTWDNWSLMPTVSFGRKGGENTYSFGIKERNLFGLGIDAEVESYTNVQRSGYKVITTIPLFQNMNTDLTIKFADNDDGKQSSVFLNKSFASFHTTYAYNIGFNEELRVDTIFQNGEDQSMFEHDISVKNISYGWLQHNTNRHALRFEIGVTQDQHLFTTANNTPNDIPTTQLPKDRDFLYPWVGINYIEKDFKKLINIHLITQIEDFNHGWQINSSLGLGDGNNPNSAWAFWHANIQKGFALSQDDLLLMNLSMRGDIYQQGNNRVVGYFNTEYFHRLTDSLGFYLNNVNVFSKNQYMDRPITMGGNTGIRGFPLQYQHGENSIKLSSELRYYPRINLFKLFDVAGAAFIDAGRAFGDAIVENAEDNWLYSAGLGLRFYSPHSGGSNNIIHLDLAFPQSNNPDIDSVEIRVQAKKSF